MIASDLSPLAEAREFESLGDTIAARIRGQKPSHSADAGAQMLDFVETWYGSSA